MAEILNPTGMMMSGGGDGGLGFGGGGGLIGGLILGTLLRNGQGGLFGGGGDGGAGAVLRSPPEQVAANMSLMQSIGAVDKSVALNAAAFEASQATQSLGLTNQFNNITSALAGRVDGVKDVVNTNNVALMQGQNTLLQNQMASTAAVQQNIMENRYELSKDISTDGEKTRALITSQYELNLQRQLADANAAIIALQTRREFGEATRGVEVTTTNNINQMQQQTQQQAQYANLAHLIYGLNQNITNGAINVGSGTLTANPSNTNTSIR
jgi:predicted  nucleic acid-binding Zn-ribbon protein